MNGEDTNPNITQSIRGAVLDWSISSRWFIIGHIMSCNFNFNFFFCWYPFIMCYISIPSLFLHAGWTDGQTIDWRRACCWPWRPPLPVFHIIKTKTHKSIDISGISTFPSSHCLPTPASSSPLSFFFVITLRTLFGDWTSRCALLKQVYC